MWVVSGQFQWHGTCACEFTLQWGTLAGTTTLRVPHLLILQKLVFFSMFFISFAAHGSTLKAPTSRKQNKRIIRFLYLKLRKGREGAFLAIDSALFFQLNINWCGPICGPCVCCFSLCEPICAPLIWFTGPCSFRVLSPLWFLQSFLLLFHTWLLNSQGRGWWTLPI